MYLSTVTLNDKNKRQRTKGSERIRKQDPHICCLLETYLGTKETNRPYVKRLKKIFYANGNEKKLE